MGKNKKKEGSRMHEGVEMLSLDEIAPPTKKMRSEVAQQGIDEMADSIRRVGVINPIHVMRKDEA
ncbi:unnamed protein product, partial [marine sediment metagenome]